MSNALPKKIDQVSSRAKAASKKAGTSVRRGAKKVAGGIKRAGKAVGKKLGA